MKTTVASALAAVLMAGLIVGCDTAVTDVHAQLIAEQDKTRQLEQDNSQLRQKLARQDKQVETLLALGDKRLDYLFYVDSIELGRYSGGWDLDGENGQDGVKVFLVPHDQYGSAVKASGAATVQLYDLAAEEGETLIGEFHWPVEKLHETWSSGFMSYHFTLDCPWGNNPPTNKNLTVRVVFVDYLTGKTFQAQKVCEIDLIGDDLPEHDAATDE